MRSMLLALLFVMACGDVAFGDATTALNGPGSYNVVDLGDLGRAGNSGAWGINSAGDIVGESATLTEGVHPFLWRDGVIQDLGTLGACRFNGSWKRVGHRHGPVRQGAGRCVGAQELGRCRRKGTVHRKPVVKRGRDRRVPGTT